MMIKCIQCKEMKDEWKDAVRNGVCKSCRLYNLWLKVTGGKK